MLRIMPLIAIAKPADKILLSQYEEENNKMKKRIIATVIALAMILALTACGSNTSTLESEAPESADSASGSPATSIPEEPPLNTDIVQPSTGSGNTPAPSELSDSDAGSAAEAIAELTPAPQYLQRLFMTYGEQKAAFDANKPEFEYNSQYYVLADDVIYDFRAKDWTVSDSDLCYMIEAKLNKFVPDLSEPMDLDDFKQFGFTYEALPEGEYYETSIRGYSCALISDHAKIYFGYSVFSYEIELSDGNLRDVHQSDTHTPGMDVGESYHELDVGYGLTLPDVQMNYMGFVAKCFYENPSAPFAHLIPKEIADAAAENDIFINVKFSNGSWHLSFISLKYSYVHTTYHDGSQDIVSNGIEIGYSSMVDKTILTYIKMNGVDFSNPAYQAVKQSINNGKEGNAFNPDTLEWTFNDEVVAGLVELMGALNTPYEK